MEHEGPSTTARRVAAHRLAFDRRPSSTGRPGDDELLARDVAGTVEVDRDRMHLYLEARTAFFDEVVVTSLDAGTRQVVVLGAGYDARSLRYARDGVRFFEVDLAGTQRDKLDRLSRLRVTHAEVTYLAADFATDDVGERLSRAGLDPTQSSLVLLEGVVPYLHVDVLEGLCRSVRRAVAEGSRFAISVGGAHRRGDVRAARRRARFRARVAAVGEPVRTTLGPDAGDALLARCGWAPDPAVSFGLGAEFDERCRRAGLMVVRAAPER